MAKKAALSSVDDIGMKRLYLEDRRITSATTRSAQNDVGVFVCSRTIRKSSSYLGLIDRIVQKSPFPSLQQRKKDYSGERNALIKQTHHGHKLYRVSKPRYCYLVVMGKCMQDVY